MPQNIQPIIDSSKPLDPPFGRNTCAIHIGDKFHRLTVVGFAGRNKHGLLVWSCDCDCGGVTLAYGHGLMKGIKRSCGCLGREATSKRSITHGMTDSITYKSWRAMRCRCEKLYNISYPRYGGRGITVCKRWRKFENFLSDMGERPSKQYQIERKDNNGSYTPNNCRWATRSEQARNRHSNLTLTHDGQTMCAEDWAEHIGISGQRLRHRLSMGWSVSRALTQPVKHYAPRPRNRLIEFNGQSKTIKEWAAFIDIPANSLRQRLLNGWSIEQALKTPHKQRRSRSS